MDSHDIVKECEGVVVSTADVPKGKMFIDKVIFKGLIMFDITFRLYDGKCKAPFFSLCLK